MVKGEETYGNFDFPRLVFPSAIHDSVAKLTALCYTRCPTTPLYLWRRLQLWQNDSALCCASSLWCLQIFIRGYETTRKGVS